MYYRLPLPIEAHCSFMVTLQGKRYNIVYNWNTEGQFGTISFYDSQGKAIVKGIKLVLGSNLLENYQYNPALPVGGLYLVRKDRTNTPPKQWEMNTEVSLIYFELDGDDNG